MKDRTILEKICAQRVLEIIRERGKIKYSELLQKTRLPKEQLWIYLDMLEKDNLIEKRIVKTRGRPATVYLSR